MSARWGFRSVRMGLEVDIVVLGGGGELCREWIGQRNESTTKEFHLGRNKHDITSTNHNREYLIHVLLHFSNFSSGDVYVVVLGSNDEKSLKSRHMI